MALRMLVACTTCAAPELLRRFYLAIVLDDRDGFASRQRGDVQHHQAQRSPSDDSNGVPGMWIRIFKAMHRAGKRFSKRGVLERHVIGYLERIFGDDPRWNANELSVSAVVKEQVVAKILLPSLAKVALPAGRGVERHNTIAGREIFDAHACLNDSSGQLVAEESRGHDHARVIATTKDLEVGAAGKSGSNSND